MTVAEKTMLKRKLKTELPYVKFPTENIKMGCRRKLTPESHGFADNNLSTTKTASSVVVRIKACSFSDSGRQLSFSENNQASSCLKGTADMIIGQQHNNSNYLDDVQMHVSERCKPEHDVQSTHNCGTTRTLECLKGQRMDADRVKQCSGILMKLMTHRYGWVFNHPVDPMKLNIPDYFSIISKPMDLGTIKDKLENMQYNYTTEFVEDIRLTFANAMRYNPPSNDVHVMAEKLGNIFNSCWRSLEARIGESQLHTLQKKTNKKTPSSRQKVQGKASSSPGSCPRKLVPSVQSRDMKITCRQRTAECLHKGPERSTGSIQTCSVSGSDTVYESTLEHGEDENSNAYSDGAVTVTDDDNADLNTYPTSSQATSGKGYESPFPEEQLSPMKALRAAILKSRFADTIFRAQQKTLLNHGEKGDLTKMQQERMRQEKRQQEEKARIEAQIRAAEAAVKRKEEEERRLQRKKEREAARLAVQNMGKTVDIDENCGLLRDLRSLGHSKHSETLEEMVINFMDGVETPGYSSNPLEQLGLFMKKEDIDDEDEDVDAWISATGDGNIEEGEIGSNPN